jgi:hypothetical protein
MSAFQFFRSSLQNSIEAAKEKANTMRISDLQSSLIEAKEGLAASWSPIDTAIWIKVCERRIAKGGLYNMEDSEHCCCCYRRY